MSIKLKLNVPDHLKVVYGDQETVTVRGQAEETYRALLLWLWSKGDSAWISRHPRRAREKLEEVLAAYPKVPKDRVRFLSPKDLTFEDYKYAVLENPDSLSDCVAWCREHVTGQVRLLEPDTVDSTGSQIDTLGLSLEERKELLAQVRSGERRDYNENDLIASITSESFYEFLLEFWDCIIPEKFIDNWHIKYICDELQIVAERVFEGKQKEYDLVINVMPGSTKSVIVSVMFPAWCWTRMPSLRFIGGSYAHQLAMDLSRKNRQLVKSTKFQLCFPTKMRADQDAKSFFMNEAGGMRLGMGTGGIAGFHAHIIAVDDPLDPNKSASDIELKAADTWIKESLAQRKVDQTLTPTILIMQRLHQNDPTGAMLERTGGEGIRHICIPAEITEDVKPRELTRFYKDGLFDPKRMPRSTLADKKKLGQFLYAGQYLQSPTMPEGGMFLWEEIHVGKCKARLVNTVRYWDKAGTEDDGAYSVGVKMAKDNEGKIWILDVVRFQKDSASREKIIKQTAQIDGKDIVVGLEQEGGSGGKESAENTKKNLRGFKVVFDRPTGDKVIRADAFSAWVNAGDVYAVPGPWLPEYLDELRNFPLSKYKDQVDASSGAFKLLSARKIIVTGGFNTPKNSR